VADLPSARDLVVETPARVQNKLGNPEDNANPAPVSVTADITRIGIFEAEKINIAEKINY